MAVLHTIPGNEQLVEQMQLAKEDQTYAKREVYLSALRKARFLVPLEWTLTKNIRHRTLSTISRPNGETFLVAFTGWNELFKWREDEEERVVALSHEELCSQVMASDSTYDGFVIDPYGVNLITYKQELIAAQPLAIPQTTRSTGREATIGTPRIFSQRMMNAIRHTLERYYVVRCAYFLLMEAEDGERNYILVLDFIGDSRRLFYSVSQAAKPFLKKSERLTIVSTESTLGRMVTRGQKPIYTRSHFAELRAWLSRQQLRIMSWREARKAQKARRLGRPPQK
ncbi:MAG: enhanced serine sensitivity protein SseB C-terminal domain-containing protein [Selenomonadales bacterium]|nr:enhanced serine sensitivity protein SseB C-terminal domain-containing protein [Selenomonadales bacterium]